MQVMPFSTGLSTTLSNFEAGLNYKDVTDPSIMVSFPIYDDPDNAALIAWTTTPWTLPSNLALCVHPEFDYVRVKDPATGSVYIVAKSRLAAVPGAVPKKGKGKKGVWFQCIVHSMHACPQYVPEKSNGVVAHRVHMVGF